MSGTVCPRQFDLMRVHGCCSIGSSNVPMDHWHTVQSNKFCYIMSIDIWCSSNLRSTLLLDWPKAVLSKHILYLLPPPCQVLFHQYPTTHQVLNHKVGLKRTMNGIAVNANISNVGLSIEEIGQCKMSRGLCRRYKFS